MGTEKAPATATQTTTAAPGANASPAAPTPAAADQTSVAAPTAPPAEQPAAAPAAEEQAKPAEPEGLLLNPELADKVAPPSAQDDFTLTIPENLPKDDKLLAEFVPLAKELGLKKEAAQKLVDLYNNTVVERNKQAEQELVKWRGEQLGKLYEACKNDKEIGGQKLKESTTAAQKAMVHFGGQELVDTLKKYDLLANEPALIKAFARVGKAMRADSAAGTVSAAPTTPKKPWELLYKQPQKQT